MKRGSQEKKTSPSPIRKHHASKKSNGIHIPLDILTIDILSRLPVKSLVRFQCVSKLWSSLITDSIVTRSLTPQPRLFVVFPRWLLQSSLFSSSTYLPNTTFTRCDLEYQYIQGLICCCSSSGEFADMFNPTKRHSVLLREIKQNKWSSSSDGFFGYDPVENQVFTLFGGSKKQQWRSLDIQGIWNHSPAATSTGLCINGIIYYIAHMDVGSQYPEFNELVWFDLRFERFDHVQMPKALQVNQLEELTLVNYKGRLGCIRYSNGSEEMLIMEDHHSKKQQEWSKIILDMPQFLLERVGYNSCIAGVTANGEIVIMPKRFKSAAQAFYACYYDPKQNKSTRVEIKHGN